MVETTIQGPTQVAGGPNGAAAVIVTAGPNHRYVLPFTAEQRMEIGRALLADEQQLQDAAARQHAASKLVVPGA